MTPSSKLCLKFLGWLLLAFLLVLALFGCRPHPPEATIYPQPDSFRSVVVTTKDTCIHHDLENPFNRTDLEINIIYNYE